MLSDTLIENPELVPLYIILAVWLPIIFFGFCVLAKTMWQRLKDWKKK